VSAASRELPPRTRVAVIGGGIAGASITYHLTRLGWSDVTLLEADELTSGSTWHAAGLCTQFIGNPHLMRLLKNSLDLYETLEEETGQPVGLHRCGSIRLAENQDRVDQFHHVRGVAEQVGVPLEIVTPEQSYDLFPLITLDGVLAGAHLPTDGHVDPSGVTNALALGATSRGARIMRHTPVTGMRHEADGWVIETAKGEIRADIVVNAAGQWARQVARLAGIDLPIVPLEHHYIVTESVEEVRSRDTELPVLRDPEGSFYARQEGDALLVGPFEQNARPWSVDGVPDNFHGRLLPGRLDQIEDVLIAASKRIPFFETTGIKTVINGPDGYTPDGRCLMGWVPGLPNYFVLAGFSIFGIVFGGGAGGYAAEWLAEGEPSEDMWDLDVRRFGPYASANGFLIPKASDAYLREYAIEFPFEERDIARPLKTGALYDRLNERGAVWGMRFGWERPQWFDRGNGGHEEYSYRRTAWHDAVGEECRAVREGVGVIDQASFAKFEVSGPEAQAYLDRLCCNSLPQKVGRMSLTQMCTPQGGIECDVTVTRLGEDRWYVVSAAATEHHDGAWLEQHLPADGSVRLDNVTARYGVLTLAGPRSRELMAAVTETDVSKEAFPFFSLKDLHVGAAPARAMRVSYVGELGFELHHPVEYGRHIYDRLLEAGEPLGLVDFGFRALESMRLEKAFRLWGPDMSIEFSPLEAGMERWVRFDKGDFIGRDALAHVHENGGPQRQLVLMTVEANGADPHGHEPILAGDELVGFVTSGGYGHRVEQSVALGYVPSARCEPGSELTIEILGERRAATVMPGPVYDPENERLLS
jgi:dimethylglycine dehydrogenase